MNKWKIGFFALLALVVIVIITIIVLLFAGTKNSETVKPKPIIEGSTLQVQTTTPEFEAIAQKYLGEALKDSPIPAEISVDDQIYLDSEISILGLPIPVKMDFDPIVEDGNLILKQTNVHIGKLNIPPATVLKLVRDSVKFPDWITVQPNDEIIYVDLSRLNIASGARVRMKEIDLENDVIILELIIPTGKGDK